MRRACGSLAISTTFARARGLGGTILAVLTNARFVIGALCMAVNFFAMLFALSIAELSLAGPAIAALTYIGNAIAAKMFLREKVDKRRWLATMFVAVGVVLRMGFACLEKRDPKTICGSGRAVSAGK